MIPLLGEMLSTWDRSPLSNLLPFKLTDGKVPVFHQTRGVIRQSSLIPPGRAKTSLHAERLPTCPPSPLTVKAEKCHTKQLRSVFRVRHLNQLPGQSGG